MEKQKDVKQPQNKSKTPKKNKRIRQEVYKNQPKKEAPPLPSVRLHLNTLENTKKTTARIIRLFFEDGIEEKKYKATLYGLQILVSTFKELRNNTAEDLQEILDSPVLLRRLQNENNT